MTDTVGRLVWALPLVLCLGVVAIVAIKRSLDRLGMPAGGAEPMSVRQSLKLSEGVQAHLLSVGTQSVLVVESNAAPVVQVLPAPVPVRMWMGHAGNKRT